MRTVVLLTLMLLGSVARAADTSLEFSGYFSHGADRRFVVSDFATRKTSDWLVEGQSFRGYTIIGFDPTEEMLTLRRANVVVRLRLKSSKVLDATPVDANGNLNLTLVQDGTILLGTETLDLPALEARLRKLAVSQSQLIVVMRIPHDAGIEKVKFAVETISPLLKEIGFKKSGIKIETESVSAAPLPR